MSELNKADITIEIVDREYIPFGLRNHLEYKKKVCNFKSTEFSLHEDGIEIFLNNKKVMFFYTFYIKSIKINNILRGGE